MKTKIVITAIVVTCLSFTTDGSLAGTTQTAPDKTKNKTVRAHGFVESARYVDVRSPLTAKILKIAPEGVVKKGDLLVELEVSDIEEKVNAQKISIEKSRSKLVQAEREREVSRLEVESNVQTGARKLKLAELSHERYFGDGGEHEVELKVIAGQVEIAKKRLGVAENQLARLTKQTDAVTAAAVDRAELAVVETKVALDAAQARERLLREHIFAHRKAESEFQLDRAKSELVRAKLLKNRTLELTAAVVEAQNQAIQVENDRLKRMEQELNSSRVHAPQDGAIVYSNVPTSRGLAQSVAKPGVLVRKRQTLIRFPDLNKLQLKILIHDEQIGLVKIGQRATIKLDAFPDRKFPGRVTKVNQLADSRNFLNRSAKAFTVVIAMTTPSDNVKLGLTGEAEINISESDHLK